MFRICGWDSGVRSWETRDGTQETGLWSWEFGVLRQEWGGGRGLMRSVGVGKTEFGECTFIFQFATHKKLQY